MLITWASAGRDEEWHQDSWFRKVRGLILCQVAAFLAEGFLSCLCLWKGYQNDKPLFYIVY